LAVDKKPQMQALQKTAPVPPMLPDLIVFKRTS
jgi:hypothetical protein